MINPGTKTLMMIPTSSSKVLQQTILMVALVKVIQVHMEVSENLAAWAVSLKMNGKLRT